MSGRSNHAIPAICGGRVAGVSAIAGGASTLIFVGGLSRSGGLNQPMPWIVESSAGGIPNAGRNSGRSSGRGCFGSGGVNQAMPLILGGNVAGVSASAGGDSTVILVG